MTDPAIRFTVSLPRPLLTELDARITGRGYASRSELVRDLIRKEMTADRWRAGTEPMVGVLSIVYDHHRRGLVDRLHAIQHDRYVHVLCTQHVHVDHHTCLETIVLRGRPEQIEQLALEIGGQKGVQQAELVRMGVAAGETPAAV
jgi:CopG family nickel-responsive transcriptional regulator